MNQVRIACYGYVGKNQGSGVGADFMILEELLNRGFEIDFYGSEGFNKPSELLDYKNFRFVSLPSVNFLKKFEERLPKTLRNLFNSTVHGPLYILLAAPAYNQRLRREITLQHRHRKYDLLFYLGLHALFKIDDVSTISWIQGPPQTEWLYFKKLKKTVISLCGPSMYLKAMAYYALERTRLRSKIDNSDFLICSSTWSRDETVAYGVDPKKVKVLPFPIDLDLFNVNKRATKNFNNGKKTLLWLGRIDPRKRLDLLLNAYRLLLKERQDVHLKIIGDLRFYDGYKKILDTFEFPEYVDYQSSINRSEVPNLFNQCDVLVQPSEGENFGFSVAEALCCGLPVVVGSTNGTKDFISSSSFVFEHYTAESLKETLVKALNAIEQFPEKLAEDSRKTAERNFSITRVVDDLEALFQEGVELRRGKG